MNEDWKLIDVAEKAPKGPSVQQKYKTNKIGVPIVPKTTSSSSSSGLQGPPMKGSVTRTSRWLDQSEPLAKQIAKAEVERGQPEQERKRPASSDSRASKKAAPAVPAAVQEVAKAPPVETDRSQTESAHSSTTCCSFR